MITTCYFHPSINPVENAKVGSFVSNLIWQGKQYIEGFVSMAVFDDAELIAGTLYHNHYPENGIIELTSASLSRRWLTRPVVKAMFSLPFDFLDVQMVVLRVSERNKSMLRIARSFGFSEVYIPRLRGRDEGEFIFTYTDDQWRASPYNVRDIV
jgi:RimJ/RimL family protein N-acetyltransferase